MDLIINDWGFDIEVFININDVDMFFDGMVLLVVRVGLIDMFVYLFCCEIMKIVCWILVVFLVFG